LYDSMMLQHGRDLGGRRFQRFRLFSQPDRVDHIASDPLVQSAGNSFDLGEFGHRLLVYGDSGRAGILEDAQDRGAPFQRSFG
jgi:hypothetical protein